MGKSSPSTPAAPDPAETAAAQSKTNKETAYWNAVLNNVNQITPYGNLTYAQTGGGKSYNMDAYNAALASYNNALSGGATTQQTGRVGLTKAAQAIKNGEKGVIGLSKQNGGKSVTSGVSVGAMPKLEDYLIGDAPPSFTSTIALSPEQQALYDSQTKQQQQLSDLGGEQIGRIRQSVADPYSYDNIGNEVRAEDVATAQTRAEEALMSRLNPQFARDEESVRSRLVNQGIQQGSEAYNREMEGLGQTKNDARMQAILSAAGYGGELQNQALARRNQGIQEYSTVRNAPLNEYIGFTSGSQVQNPQFQNTSYQGAAAPDYASLVNNKYQSDVAAANAKTASNNANMGALGSLLGTGLSFGLGGGAGGVGKSLFGYNLW